MKSKIFVSGPGLGSLESAIPKIVKASGVPSLALAIAYVSRFGADYVSRLQAKYALTKVRLICDTGDCVTHPEALRLALNQGWAPRAVSGAKGTFHAKYLVLADDIEADGQLVDARAALLGSANLSYGGLKGNVECSFLRVSPAELPGASAAFRSLWSRGVDVDAAYIDKYEKAFIGRNRSRSSADLTALGVSDLIIPSGEIGADQVSKSTGAAYSPTSASAAWAGLESFTGDFAFQVEFPRSAGEVLGRLFKTLGVGPDVVFNCDDGIPRSMHYAFYEANSMFRLNIKNDVPHVAAARAAHQGIALVEIPKGAAPSVSIVMSKTDISEIIKKSIALGTIGKTPTRLYGWF